MRGFKEFLNEESANGVVEVILILVDNYLSLIPM